jgi:hypothetical protein
MSNNEPTMLNLTSLRVADEVWLTVARLHQNHPDREGFSPAEIIAEGERTNLTGAFRKGFAVHVYLHCVANHKPNPGAYRMLFRLPNEDRRLFRTGDPAHPARDGKITPERSQIPAEFHRYLDWYESVYCEKIDTDDKDQTTPRGPAPSARSFIDKLSGLGKQIWSGTSADDYVSELRKGWE